jgi:hypothetical protein
VALPESKFSYLLQDWDQNFSIEQPPGIYWRSYYQQAGVGAGSGPAPPALIRLIATSTSPVRPPHRRPRQKG